MQPELVRVTIEKLVEGGQGLGTLPDGRKVFVWNALPDEVVGVRIIKKKHSYAEGIAEAIATASPDRIVPEEENYLATSPWQMMTFDAENKHKKQLVHDIFAQAKVQIPSFKLAAPADVFHYRNKMEYGFWGDDDGLHLAGYRRGTHGKQIITGSKLAMPGIDRAAQAVCQQIGKTVSRAGDLKTIIVRSSQKGEIVASLYVKREDFYKLELPPELKGLRVYYSNPKSPASVRTKLLQELGDATLHDTLLGKDFVYDVDSFFQVNLPIYERALQAIKDHNDEPSLVDLYSGVGSIGLSVATTAVELVELDASTAAMARENAAVSRLDASVIEAPAEKAIEYIVGDKPVIVDPPRAGLHDRVVTRLLETLPPKITYLSCNPTTQARDIALLQDHYEIAHFEAFNFFPRTPHIETLAILQRRAKH